MKEMEKIKLSDHFTYGRLLKFVYSPILTMVFVSVYGIIDGLFVSNFVGKTEFAALNLIMPVLMIIGALGYMLSTGGSAIVAKTLGEGNDNLANKYFSMLVYVILIAGILFMLIAHVFLKDIAVFLGAEGEMLKYCIKYARITLCSMPFYMLQYFFQQLFITAEKPKLGFGVTLLSGCMNIIMDALFIAVFHWGLEGAALATALSEFIGGTLPLVYFFRKNDSLLRLVKTKIYWRALGKACANGSSEFVMNISSSVVTMLFNMQLLKFAGENGVAAYGVIMYVCFIFIAIFCGYAIGVAPIISYNYGAKTHDELKNVVWKSLKMMGILGCLMTIICSLFAKVLAGIFVGYDAELLALTVSGLRIYSFSFLFAGFNIFGSSLFTALNNGLISATISFLRTLVFECGSVLILPIFFGLTGVWSSIIVAEVVAITVTAIFFFAKRKTYHY